MPTAFCCCLGYRSSPLYSQVVPLHISARSYSKRSYRSQCHFPSIILYPLLGRCLHSNSENARHVIHLRCPTSNRPLMFVSAVQIFIIVITVLLAVGIITCVLSHYKMGARSWSDQRNRQQPSTRQLQQPCPQQPQYTYSLTPTTTSMMYTPATVQERQRLEAGAHHDHLVRLHSVQTDLALNLPHSIALPDGEEGPRCDAKFLKLRDPEQHAEITRSFIRPPPNRTVPDGNSLPPFRSNSVGLLQKPTTPPLTQADTTVLVARSYSVSSSNAHGGKQAYPRGQCTPVSNPTVSSHVWLPSSVAMNARMSGTSGNSNRTYGCTKAVTEKFDGTDPPPPYNNVVVNQWDVNTVSRQQNSGV